VTARDYLVNCLAAAWCNAGADGDDDYLEQRAAGLVDAFAHELAEQIREFAKVADHSMVSTRHVQDILEWAAIEIDPEVDK
jgi:hypothetical protein